MFAPDRSPRACLELTEEDFLLEEPAPPAQPEHFLSATWLWSSGYALKDGRVCLWPSRTIHRPTRAAEFA